MLLRRHFRRLLASAALLLAPLFPAAAQGAAAPAAAAETATDADPALWVIRDDDTTIYLFGTVHVLRPGLSWFDEAVADAFNASDELVTEIPQDDDPAVMQTALRTRGAAADATLLTARLSDDQRATYSRAMDSIGMPVAAFEHMDPWVPSIMLTAIPLARRGYDPSNGVERVLFRAAQERGKATSALETADLQFGFFDSLPQPAQIDLLNYSAQQALSDEDPMQRLTGLWASGDADGLGQAINAEFTTDPDVRAALLTRRNANWAEWIKLRLAEPGGKYFVAVGAGHLAGDDSVQAILARDGIIATRVQY